MAEITRARATRNRKPVPPPSWMVPRPCEYCKRDYMPRSKTQRWCKTCAPDKATQERLRKHGSPLPTSLHAIARLTGVLTCQCKVCDGLFTYDYIGGAPRQTCDEHRPAVFRKIQTATRNRRPCCVVCEKSVMVVDEAGRCSRDSPHEKVEVACRTCGSRYRAAWFRPRAYCSTECRARSRFVFNPTCALCDVQFPKTHSAQKYCTGCVQSKADAARARLYGISRTQFAEMKARYGGMCWICRRKPGECVDHCHKTGRARGWLCHHCNHILSYVELPGWLDNAASYLA